MSYILPGTYILILYYIAFILNSLHTYNTKTLLDRWSCCANNNNNIIKYKTFKLFMLPILYIMYIYFMLPILYIDRCVTEFTGRYLPNSCIIYTHWYDIGVIICYTIISQNIYRNFILRIIYRNS